MAGRVTAFKFAFTRVARPSQNGALVDRRGVRRVALFVHISYERRLDAVAEAATSRRFVAHNSSKRNKMRAASFKSRMRECLLAFYIFLA